jgi:hypothetical protein
MACVALENALSGGGTRADHEPMKLFCNEERAIFGVIREWHGAKVGAKLSALLKRRLAKNRLMTQAQIDLPDASPVKLGKIHKFARIADAEFRAIELLAAGLSPVGKTVVTAFEADYLIGYVGRISLDGSKPEDFQWIDLPTLG